MGRELPLITREELKELYLTQKMPMCQIANFYGIAVGTVFNKLHSFEIPTRMPHKGFQGKKHTEDAKQRISLAHKGKVCSAEIRERLSQAKTGAVIKPSKYGGHTKRHRSGYILVYLPTHPFATKDGYIFEHILAYESANNCIVDRNRYVIHHINEIKTDNRPENLMLMTKQEHMAYHTKKRYKEKKQLCRKYL